MGSSALDCFFARRTQFDLSHFAAPQFFKKLGPGNGSKALLIPMAPWNQIKTWHLDRFYKKRC